MAKKRSPGTRSGKSGKSRTRSTRTRWAAQSADKAAKGAQADMTVATTTAGGATPTGQQVVVCAGYSLKAVNQFGVITDDFRLEALDAQQNTYVAQGSILDQRSIILLQRIAQAKGGVGWTFTATNGRITG
jgi:hypothetical protein